MTETEKQAMSDAQLKQATEFMVRFDLILNPTMLAVATRLISLLADQEGRIEQERLGYERGRDAVFAQVEDITHGNYTAEIFRSRFREGKA